MYPKAETPWFTERNYEDDTSESSLDHQLAIMEPTDPASVEIGFA